ncbi:SAM-dependent methyltransferase [Streptomyces johnsoniae]|uniref:SAM-dependent methyltransferase n=1 Tax=Streptomyces johnsoniae TaxID=3075532 RepID=A0ABU2S684_9ACTN|nr:SAM-dependent methyltransferase [Streptomyces sp. DSM 41886]MDT0444486.1 SAM-dependent methyltransferase [Streptomyces sp. DSM 41886]
MERSAWAQPGIDPSVPSLSRMYDFYLGGSHNFEADRAAAREAIAAFPGLPALALANRAFLRRAVRYAVAEGVSQFVDIGSGILTFGNVHEIARRTGGDTRVVYVDNDPVTVAHSRAVLAGDDRTDILAADLRGPSAILDSEQVGRLIDLGRPVALLLVAVMHFLGEDDKPHERIAELRDMLAPGSLLALTHASPEHRPTASAPDARISEVYRKAGATLALRSGAEITHFFEGFDLVPPGVVPLPDWRPDGPPDEEGPKVNSGFAGVGRKG